MNLASTQSIASHVRDPVRSIGFVDATAAPAPVQLSEESAPKETAAQSSGNALPNNTRLAIERDEASNRYVFKAIDQITGEVVRQYPTEQMLLNIAQVHRVIGLTLNTAA